MSRGKASRGWQVTINNPSQEFLDNIRSVVTDLKGLLYACWAQERGNETGTHHVHIYLQYSNGRYFSTIKNLFPKAHIEAAVAGPAKNRDYIMKEEGGEYDDGTSIRGTFEEYGTMKVKQDDMWTEVYELAKQGLTPIDIIDEYPAAIKWIRQIRELCEELKYYEVCN